MKKLWLLVILLLVVTQCYALTWTKNWSASDDGSILSGSDIQSFQNDVSSQGINQNGDNTFSGNITFSGTSALSGSNTFSGTTNITPHVHLMVRPAGTYTTVKVGSFTRDISLGDGTQSVTGVGFKPSSVVFFATVNGDTTASWGFGNSTTGGGYVVGQDHWGDPAQTSNQPIYVLTDSDPSYAYTSTTMTLDSDGFTVTWNVISAPTGTAIIAYMAFSK